MVKKKRQKKENRKVIFIILIVVGAIFAYSFFGGQKQPEEETKGEVAAIVNKGVAMKMFIGDRDGNVIKYLSVAPKTLSILSPETGTGYSTINNVNQFLYANTSLDNRAGDSVVRISDIIGTNPCTSGNTNPGCTGIQNIFGSAGTNKGNLDAKWDPQLPLILDRGQMSQWVTSDGMSVAPIEFGLIDFRVDVLANYQDAQGNWQTLTGVFGKATLRITKEKCTDETPTDPTIGDADQLAYCSTSPPNKGKYCRIGATGSPSLTDRASLCGCPSGYTQVGEICKSLTCGTSWTPNTCESGGVLFCKSDGSVESRCNQCSFSNCPRNANGDSATGCSPASPAEPSTCVYPPTIGGGFLVKVEGPSFTPIAQCGDGVKSGSEQCDTNDFGGQSCTSQGFAGGTLTCSASCTYVTTACQSAYVGFRTSSRTYPSSISADNWIAYKDTGCGNSLIGYGYNAKSGGTTTSLTSTTNNCSVKYGTPLITNVLHDVGFHLDVSYVASGNGIISLHRSGSNLALCENAPNSGGNPVGNYGYYIYKTSQANNAVTSATSVSSSREVAC